MAQYSTQRLTEDTHKDEWPKKPDLPELLQQWTYVSFQRDVCKIAKWVKKKVISAFYCVYVMCRKKSVSEVGFVKLKHSTDTGRKWCAVDCDLLGEIPRCERVWCGAAVRWHHSRWIYLKLAPEQVSTCSNNHCRIQSWHHRTVKK